MARSKIRLGNTGPQRKAGSRLCIPCAYKKCKSQLDVTNVGSKLKVKRIRVPAQLTDLFHVLIRDGASWAVVAALLCMSCGERAGCIVKAKFGWLQNLSPAAKDLPCIGIQKVNGKTKQRNIPLPWELARLLHKWIHEQPLVGGPSGNAGNSQWPFEGQSTSSDAYMFPSATVHGLRLRDIAIGRKGFHKRLATAADIICRERAGCCAKQQRGMDVPQSVWENYNFSKLGTHSLKRSSVTLMKEVCKSTTAITTIQQLLDKRRQWTPRSSPSYAGFGSRQIAMHRRQLIPQPLLKPARLSQIVFVQAVANDANMLNGCSVHGVADAMMTDRKLPSATD